MLRGLGDLTKMGAMVKQAMEMKQRIEELKERLGDERVEASAGGGMVKVLMSGKMEVLSVHIEAEVLRSQDAELVGTLVQAAVNEAVHKTQELVKQKMQEIAGGLDIPGLT